MDDNSQAGIDMNSILFDKARGFYSELFADSQREIFNDDDQKGNKRILLSHYTSIFVVEKIIREKVIWLSNPLFMNDFEEMRFGIIRGRDLFIKNAMS